MFHRSGDIRAVALPDAGWSGPSRMNNNQASYKYKELTTVDNCSRILSPEQIPVNQLPLSRNIGRLLGHTYFRWFCPCPAIYCRGTH